MIKFIVKRILPHKVYNYILQAYRIYIKRKQVKSAYKYDFYKTIKYSELAGQLNSMQLLGLIIREYHVVEKGLTMPQTRLGFGKDVIIDLANNCIDYIQKYSNDEIQLKYAINVLAEYKHFHLNENFQLENDVQNAIDKLFEFAGDIAPSHQIEFSREDYFKYVDSNFAEFSNSRHSVRNYCDANIDSEDILKVLDTARNTPSACNRQPWRTYVYREKHAINEILKVQGGNRGFGHLTNVLLVITSDLCMYTSVEERNAPYVDGGMYAMNVLYSLHANKIAACILNCSNSVEKDLLMREVTHINESEVFIAMISCGIPPENFKVASSLRYPVSFTNKFMN